MTIGETVKGIVDQVLANSWAVELPPNPAFPAITFEIDSAPESGWVLGGGYTQHIITVTTFSYTKAELISLVGQVHLAFEAVTGFITEEESGDAVFEDMVGVYAYFQNFRIRTSTYQ